MVYATLSIRCPREDCFEDSWALRRTPVQITDSSLERARHLHKETSVVDAVSPLMAQRLSRAVEEYLAGGVSIVGASVELGPDLQPDASQAFRSIAKIRDLMSTQQERVQFIGSIADARSAKASRRLGVLLHFQNCTPFERTLSYVEMFHRLGIRVAGLTYNIRNAVGDGCIEPADAGLSRFGRRLVKEMARVGITVDGSHTGVRTSLDAIELCDGPFVFSHNGCRSVYDHPRNLTDEQIKACAATGGVIGVFGVPYFLAASPRSTLEDVLRHVTHLLELVGADHVGLGLDYFDGVLPYTTAEAQARQRWEGFAHVVWERSHRPDGAWSYAPEIETPAGLHALTAALLDMGVSDADARKIIGENWIRVFAATWRSG